MKRAIIFVSSVNKNESSFLLLYDIIYVPTHLLPSMPKVLLIDDHAMVAEALAFVLESEGYDVITADGGKLGIALAHEHHPDVIVSDYRMPDVNGLDVLQAVRETPEIKKTPFVILTMETHPSVRNDAIRRGADAFVTKSHNTEELISAINRLLS